MRDIGFVCWCFCEMLGREIKHDQKGVIATKIFAARDHCG